MVPACTHLRPRPPPRQVRSLPGGAARVTCDRANPARWMQHPTAAAASLQPAPRPGARSPLSILRATFAQSPGWVPGAGAAPPRSHNPCPPRQTPRPSQRSAPARERCRWTTTRPPGTDAAGNDNQTMPVSAGKSPARKPQRFVPSVPRQWQVPRAAAPLHFAKAPQSPPRAAGLLDRLSRSKPARATERSRSRTAGRAQPRPPHAGSPGSPARETAVSGAANNNKPACERQREKLGEETIFSSTLPQRVL